MKQSIFVKSFLYPCFSSTRYMIALFSLLLFFAQWSKARSSSGVQEWSESFEQHYVKKQKREIRKQKEKSNFLKQSKNKSRQIPLSRKASHSRYKQSRKKSQKLFQFFISTHSSLTTSLKRKNPHQNQSDKVPTDVQIIGYPLEIQKPLNR